MHIFLGILLKKQVLVYCRCLCAYAIFLGLGESCDHFFEI